MAIELAVGTASLCTDPQPHDRDEASICRQGEHALIIIPENLLLRAQWRAKALMNDCPWF
jgi:hypothetical protein